MRGPKETARDLAFDRAAVAKRRYARSQRAAARIGKFASATTAAETLAKLAQDLADRAQAEYEQSEEFGA